MDFTVCIPVRNRINLANKAIKSILDNSEYPIMVIDDNSDAPDGGYITHDRVKIVYNKTKSGLSSMWNQFLRETDTEYLIFSGDKITFRKSDFELIERKLNQGFGVVGLYLLGVFGFSKHLITKIGIFDDEFRYGGYEDTDLYNRLFSENIGIYVSLEANYLPILSGWVGTEKNEVHYNTKWEYDNKNRTLRRLQPLNFNGVESYKKYQNNGIKYLTWDQSELKASNLQKYYNNLKLI